MPLGAIFGDAAVVLITGFAFGLAACVVGMIHRMLILLPTLLALLAGFGFYLGHMRGQPVLTNLGFWAVLGLTLALPPGWLWCSRYQRLRIQSQRRAAGQCLACGYNLTGNTTGTCPECGKRAG